MVDLARIRSSMGAYGSVNSAYAGNFQGFINDLESTGFKVGTIGGYNYRTIAGTDKLSNHAFGNAIDINPFSGGNSPGGRSGAHGFPDNISEIASKNGLSWGGNWNNPDTMHFEVAKGATSKAAAGEPLAADTTSPYGFSKMNAGNMGDSKATTASDYGEFSDFSKGGEGGMQTGPLDAILGKLKKSKDTPEAIDQQTGRISNAIYKNTQDTLKQEQAQWSSDRATFKDYFTRAVFILVGLLALWAGLRAFTNVVPGPLETAAKVVPVARAARKLKSAVA